MPTYCSGWQFFPWRRAGQPLCQAREEENEGDRMVMRRPEALPANAVPRSAPLCQPVMNLWGSAPLTQSFFTHCIFTPEKDRNRWKTHTHTVQYLALTSDGLFVCRQHIVYAPRVRPADYVKHTDLRHKQEKYGKSQKYKTAGWKRSEVRKQWREQQKWENIYIFFKCMCE